VGLEIIVQEQVITELEQDARTDIDVGWGWDEGVWHRIENEIIQVKYQADTEGKRRRKLAIPGPFVLDTAIDGPTLKPGRDIEGS